MKIGRLPALLVRALFALLLVAPVAVPQQALAAGPAVRVTTLAPPTIALGQAVAAPDADAVDTAVFAGWGQSNKITGMGLNKTLDRRLNPRVYGVMRSPANPAFALKAVYAAEPLENESQSIGAGPSIGNDKAFAENLLAYKPGLVMPGEKILLTRYAVGGTGFSGCPTQANWVKGCALSVYDGALAHTQLVLAAYPRGQLRAVLWDQGQEDYAALDAATYATTIDAFIAQVRADLNAPDLPFILTTLSTDAATFNQRSADIRLVPSRVPFTAVADDYAGGQSGLGADTITGPVGVNDEVGSGYNQDGTHYSAWTQRTYRAPRVLAAYERALTHNNPGGVDAAPTVPAAITDLSVTANKDGYVVMTMTPPGASGGPSNGGAAIEGYLARLSTDGGATWFDAPVRWTGKLRPLTGLTNGLAYLVQVKAYNRGGVAASWSNSAAAAPVAVDFSTGLLHRMAPSVASNTFVDTVGGATVVKNATFANDGLIDYAATNASAGYGGLTVNSVHPSAVAISVWHYATAYATSKGVFSEWSSSAQVASILYHASTSGSLETMRAGPVAASTAFSSSITTSSMLNTWCNWLIVIDDDGTGTTDRWRIYLNGVLKGTLTGQARRSGGDRWMTGQGSLGTTNSLAARYGVIRIYNANLAAVNDDWIAKLVANGPGY